MENNMADQTDLLSNVEFLSSESDAEDQDENNCDLCVIRDKKSQEKKRELLNLIHQFHTRLLAIEKEKKSQLYRKSDHQDVFRDLEEHEQKMDFDRRNDKASIKDNLNRIRDKVGNLEVDKQKQIKGPLFITKLRSLIEQIEDDITQLKSKQRVVYEELTVQEESLSNEVEKYERRFEQWTEPVYKLSPKNALNLKENADQNELPVEVQEFEEFLKLTGGHSGGWDDYDHNVFLKCRRRHKLDSQLITVAIGEIPTRDRDDIIQHVQWFHEYNKLLQKKREAIRVWKLKKENARDVLLANVDCRSREEGDAKNQTEKEERIRKERLKRLEQLRMWKEQKRKTESKEMEEEFQKSEQERLCRANEEKKKLKLKLQVEEYRRRKNEEDDVVRVLREASKTRERRTVTAEEKEKIRERNEKLLWTKREHRLAKDWEVEQKTRRLDKLKENVTVKVQRDPSRLYKLTEGLIRRRDDTNEEKQAVITGARLMPRRAVPSWRQNVV